MTFDRSRLAGAGLILLGLVLLSLGASASLGLLGEMGERSDASPQAPSAAATPQDSPADVHAQALVGTLGVARDVPLPVAAPIPARVDREVGGANLPIPVSAQVGLRNAEGGQGQRQGQGAGTTIATFSQRAIGPSATTAVAVGAAIATTAGLVVYFWAGIKAWAARALVLPIVTLYAKVTRAEVFDNAVRERIFGAIKEHPGRSASDLAKLAGVSWGTTIYHLEVLEQNRMVTSLRQGRHRRYFENGAPLTASKEIVSLLQNSVTALVVDRVRAQPGLTQKDLAGVLGMSPQALHWHLARLQRVGVVQKQREGRVVRHFVLN